MHCIVAELLSCRKASEGFASLIERAWKGRSDLAMRILLVDDKRNSQLALAKILREDGYDVTVAGTEEEALNRLEHSSFDSIITDMFLFRKSCVRLLEKIGSLEVRTPVILASGHNDVDRYIDESRTPDMMRISKPIEYDELKRLIEDIEARGEARETVAAGK